VRVLIRELTDQMVATVPSSGNHRRPRIGAQWDDCHEAALAGIATDRSVAINVVK